MIDAGALNGLQPSPRPADTFKSSWIHTCCPAQYADCKVESLREPFVSASLTNYRKALIHEVSWVGISWPWHITSSRSDTHPARRRMHRKLGVILQEESKPLKTRTDLQTLAGSGFESSADPVLPSFPAGFSPLSPSGRSDI